MRSTNRSRRVATWFFVTIGAVILGAAVRTQTPGETVHIVLVGDSTVAEGGGWGPGFRASFGPDVRVTNLALNGRSSKSFLDEGAWAPALAAKPNYILIQFGHNDEPGKGPERETDPATTYRANLTRYVREAREVGAMPILVTSIVRRKLAADGKVQSDSLQPYVEAVRSLAIELHVLVMDLNALTRTQCETLGPAACAALGVKVADGAVGGTADLKYDTTHLGPEGQQTVGALASREFVRVLLPAQPRAEPKALTANTLLPLNRARTTFPMPEPRNPRLPTLFVIGDSTVRNGRGDGADGLWGWGDPLADAFDTTRINVVNRAVSGLSSRTYRTLGHWDRVLALMKAGDVVLMQFGHNDASAVNDPTRARGSLPGTGNETTAIDNLMTGQAEVVHTYGWYLRQLVSEARAKGATVIVCSPVPRNSWQNGRVARSDTYVAWARTVAAATGAGFVDLNDLVARRYDALGSDVVGRLFPTDNTHTSRAGAEIIANEVVQGLKSLPSAPLAGFLLAGRRQQAPWEPDLGTGFYRNPVIFADYSDPDVVRVGQDFYLVSSSFNASPGLPILHSRDLVNWTIVGHAAATLPSPRYDEPKHGQGMWAPSLRYHDGRFWVYVGDPDLGIFVTTATDPRGPWEPLALVAEARGWIDPCPLWDDDGQVYLVHAWAKSRAGFNGRLTVRRLTRDGLHLADAIDTTVFDGGTIHPTIEGPKFYKRGGFYYVFAPAGGVTNGWQTVLRSRSVLGPYEARIVLDRGRTSVNGPHQGGWVDAPDGTSWFVHFQDRGAYGRIVHLQPMVWRDDWPVMGSDPDGDGTGEPVSTFRMPVAVTGQRQVVPQTTDEFGGARLGLQWQWQANPRSEWMSLSARPGFLRLSTQPLPGADPNLWTASHLLMQKLPAETFEVTTAVHLNARATGDAIALVVLGLDYAEIRLSRTDNGWRLEQVTRRNADTDGQASIGSAVAGTSAMQLRVSITAGKAEFSYSPDGARFQTLGEPFTLREGRWVGAKFGLIATRAAGSEPGGSADVDWVRVR